MQLKIYLDDGFALEHGGGIGVYADILFRELTKRGYQVTRANHPILNKIANKMLRRLLYSLYLFFVLPHYLKKHRYTVAHFTNFQVPFLKNKTTKYVATIHDLSPILFPETVPASYARYFGFMLKTVIRNSDNIITVSESVKMELQNFLNGRENNINVCYSNLRDVFVDKKIEETQALEQFELTPRDYFLFVSRLERRKNIQTLLRAFEQFKVETQSEKKLVLVGSEGFGFEEIQETIHDCEHRNDIVMTGYISDQQLKELYHGALAVVFPSLYEGFGLPLFEAMVFQRPLIVSRIPTNLEILDSRGYFFEKENIDELKTILKEFETKPIAFVDYSDILKKYSLERMIDLHLEVYSQPGRDATKKLIFHRRGRRER